MLLVSRNPSCEAVLRFIDLIARNNLRLMTKGDMAFFYHSNCKEPGIVGTMEVVEEHSVDSKLTNSRTHVRTSLFILTSNLRHIFLPCSDHYEQ